MGRTQPTNTTQPQSLRRATRAKKARETLNKTIPNILSSHARARKSVESAELIVNPPPNANGTGTKPSISLRKTDTITAARDASAKNRKVAILNMASPLRPGGGFLQGATSQEEFLCMRSTLYPSLREELYRLPEVGAVYSRDVLVFRNGKGEDVGKKERFFVDIVSAGMLRFPEVVGGENDGEEIRYADEKDREVMVEKMRAVLRVMATKGASTVVLGAWGCGAYGNPVAEVAEGWRKVLLGSNRKRKGKGEGKTETWEPIEEVVFAISDGVMAEKFQRCFGADMEVVGLTDGDEISVESGDDQFNHQKQIEETEARIEELEEQLGEVRTVTLRAGLQGVLNGLKKQLISLMEAQANVAKDRGLMTSLSVSAGSDESLKSNNQSSDEEDDDDDDDDNNNEDKGSC